jgi:hypothetical protein
MAWHLPVRCDQGGACLCDAVGGVTIRILRAMYGLALACDGDQRAVMVRSGQPEFPRDTVSTDFTSPYCLRPAGDGLVLPFPLE